MINKELVKYFNKGLNLGHSENVLKKELLNSGWNEVDINDSFSSVSKNTINKVPTIPNFPNSTNSNNSNMKKERPTGVSILAVLIWINAGVFALFAILSLFLSSLFVSLIGNLGSGSENVWILSIIFFISFLLFSLFLFFYGKGLWRGKNGWRIFYLILASLGVLMGISGLFSSFGFGLFQLIISGFLFWYLGFKKNVVEFFKK